jgi:L-aspartate oxidase
MAAGIDPVSQLIPVAPAAHYHMGGIATDEHGRTSVEGLWSAGEVSSTGLHGANRLASNSLLEAIVFGARVADDIKALVPPEQAAPIAKTYHVTGGRPIDHDLRRELVAKLRRTMSEHAGVVRSAHGLEKALSILREIEVHAGGDTMVANMAVAAQLIAGSALLRRESRGAHFRSDYPDADPRLARRTFVTLDDIRRIENSRPRRLESKGSKLAAAAGLAP